MQGCSRQTVFMLVLLLGFAPASLAGPLTGSNGLQGLGSYSGDFDYTVIDAGHATLSITLTNTSPAANGGYLTAFALNNPFDPITGVDHITGVSLSSSNANFGLLGLASFHNGIN